MRKNRANSGLRTLVNIALCSLSLLLSASNVFSYGLEGQNALRANAGTNYFGGPLRGWNELEFIPCRVVLQPGSNQVVQINFDHTKNASIIKRGLQNLFSFAATDNVKITTPVLTGLTSMEDWYYTFTADVTNNQTGYVYFTTRLCAGAHLFGGSSLSLSSPPLQIMKPGPVSGNPDLMVTKIGPASVLAGNSYTYSVTFSNKANASATAVGIQLSDFLPAGTTYVAGSATASGLITNLAVQGNQLFWDVLDMDPGTSGTVTYQVQVPTSIANGTVIQNYAQIECAQDDANEADNVSIVTTTVLNTPPTAVVDTYTINKGQALTVAAPGVLANDSDVNNLPLKSLLVTNVTSGTVTLNTDGSFSYTPSASFVGVDTFYYVATNGFLASQPAKVTINILQMAAPPDTNVLCVSSVPAPATDLTQFIAQGGVASGPYCGQSTSVTFMGDASNGGSGCPSSPLVISRTYKLTTGCGDVTNVIQKITVVDSSVPTITSFPADATYSCASEVPAANDSLIGQSDNCSGAVTVSHDADVITSGSCPNRYSIARTYRVSDSCGNSTSRTQHITVNDQTAPTITVFPSDATYSCANAVPSASDSLVTATDNCSGSVTVSHDADIVTSSNCVNRFTISRTYRVTDSCGNATSKTQTITINGTTAPAFNTFPADATYSCANAVPAANDSLVVANNACGGASVVTITHDADVITSSNCVNHFTIARTYVATDACGNSSSKTQTIIVDGTTPPTITVFPADASYSCASSVPAANDSLVAAVDNCGSGAATITHDADLVTSSNCVNRFTISRTYHVTDSCGNATSKTQTINVNSTIAPTITAFPVDATYSCATAVPNADDSLVSATDGCGASAGLVITHNADVITSSNCVNRFSIARTYVATDACGNTASKTQTITVNGTTAPTIAIFPPDATYSCANAVPAANDSLVSATDGCGASSGIVIAHAQDVVTSSNCVNRFTITRTYIATDACGNSSSKNQTITVDGTTPPTITAFPEDATYSCASTVPSANDSLISALDNCGATTVTITHDADLVTSSNCVNRFTINRTFHVTDACGNATSKTQKITVNGTTAPTIATFPGDATYSCANSVPAADNTLVTATDGCGASSGITITHTADLITASNCVNRFTLTRTYVATDACGNSSSKNQTITVDGTTPPTITAFPEDATYSCAGSVPAANNSLITALDHCGASTVTITHDADLITSSNCVNRFTIDRTYHVTDACGNATSRTQKITVNAITAPTIANFPADATYSCASAVPNADNTLVTATDGCGATGAIVITHLDDSVTSSNCVNRFIIARTYIATDACGNSSTRTQNITVNGTTAPTIVSFPSNRSYSCANLVPAPDDALVTAVDNCGAASITVTHDADLITESNCPNRFTITRTYRVTDACGNFTTRNQIIIVNDTRPPGLVLPLPPREYTFSCASEIPPADDSIIHAVDNCGGGVVVTHDSDVLVSSNCINRFTLVRVYHVVDSCGNATNLTQTIHVDSTTAPTITTFPADATYSCPGSVPAADDTLVTAIDGCGTGQVHISHGPDAITSATCENRYVIHRTYTAVDSCGNSSSKTQVITINNTTPPAIVEFPVDATVSCPGDIPAPNNALVSAVSACGSKSGMIIAHAPDVITSSNCVNRFTIARTYIATDSCGNSTSRTQTIAVNATTAPTITTFPADTTYTCANAVPPANDALVTAMDGCGFANPVTTHLDDVITSTNCANRFTIARTYIATDSCGNSASKVQTITVNATNAPVFTAFPPDATFECSASVPATDDSLVQAIDNCGGATISVTHDSDVIISNICVNHFIIARTYHITDSCGNSANRTQTITVNDTISPTISCPPGFTVSHFEDIPGPDTEAVQATDNCSVPAKSFVGETYATNNSIITITRTFAATDDCGNSATCSQIITMDPFLAQPTAQPDSYSVLENATLNTASAGVLANDQDPNNLSLEAILVSGTTHGALTLNADGSFQYVPQTNYVGPDSFTYQPSNGGNAPGAPVTVNIDVIFVNQQPSFTKGVNQIVHNYQSAQTRAGWASNISPGPANESAQTVQFLVSNDNDSIFSVQPAISPNGTLTYAPAPGRYGIATVSAVVKDNGGTANGGRDTSATQAFSIIVNNPPTANINIPTNTSLFLYPSPVGIIATATDIDGTVTNVTFYNGTNAIGQGTPTGNNQYAFTWTNAPASNSVLYALATDNYGATNLSAPINIQLGNPVLVSAGSIVFSPSLFSWGQSLSVTNPTISSVQSVTVTFTSVQPAGTTIVGVTGTNDLGQPYITFNNTVPPVSGIDNYATILYVAPTKPIVTFTTTASLTAGPTFTVDASAIVPISRRQFQNDGSFLLNFVSQTNRTYFVQYTSDLKNWFTSPVPLKGNGTQLQWVDFGPSVTVSKPRSAPYRFYRVVAPQDH